MLNRKIKLSYFSIIVSCITLLLFNYPFFKYVFNNCEVGSLNGIFLVVSLIILAIILNALVFYILLFLLRKVGKTLLIILLLFNSVALYFVNTYSVILDRNMMGNVYNTNFEESSSFFSIGFIMYLLFLGIVPSVFVYKTEVIYVNFKKFITRVVVTLLLVLGLVYANATNWLWIDKNSTKLGALTMPWSYVVNSFRYFHKINKENQKQILLPNATIKNDEKSVVVLVIGESARSQNFSLYGYQKDTNPLLSKIPNVKHYNAESCATYTTAGVKCILEHQYTDELYEILPNYLYRNNVEVIWRTSNWGEPTVTIEKFITKGELQKDCKIENCDYDEILLSGLKEQILTSKKNKILVVLHTSTSHGPTYYKKHPVEFSKFLPECENVELANCSQEELINAYDNTIVYTDYILAKLIGQLEELKEFKSSMIFISDHGESLGEKNLYMHGLPKSMAPNVQFEIPFIVWASNNQKLTDKTTLDQHYVFHSVLDFLAIDSPVYDKNMTLFE